LARHTSAGSQRQSSRTCSSSPVITDRLPSDEAAGLRLKTSRPATAIWTNDEVARWLDGAGVEEAHMTTAFLLLQFNAQRPTDVCG